ncbi:MAG: hypothetical protein QOE45_1414 [Frankiaceae bacterium]|nr:hypothetical protein [Frankiaceae bacterium]
MTAGHAVWEELAAGHALSALEPEDEQAFLAHLRGCDRCAADLAALRETVGEIGYAAEPVDLPPDLGRRIMDAARAERPAALAPPAVAPLRRPGRAGRVRQPALRLAPLAAAAAVLLVVALGAWNLDLRTRNAATTAAIARRNAALACLAAPGSATVRLRSTDQARGTACVAGDRAYVVVDRLPENDTARSVYVLWWQDRANGLHPVERFDVEGPGTSVFALPIAVAPSDVRGMAVSLEPGRALPARPTVTVASGPVVAA